MLCREQGELSLSDEGFEMACKVVILVDMKRHVEEE
jgi:hypothetical protein